MTSSSYDTLSTTIDIIVILLLLVLLVLKELMRAAGGPRFRMWVQTLNIVIVPLALIFALIAVMRFLSLVQLV